MVLVTGAGGKVGLHLLRALSARGIRTRAWIHSSRSEHAVRDAGADELFIGDLTSQECAAEAMKGVDTVFFICNTANPREDEIGAQLIQTAKQLGGITFVYHSVLHSLLAEMPHHRRKQAVEKTLVDSGLPYVILQPAVFLQMLTLGIQSVKNGGLFVQKFYTSEQTKMSFVDMADYAQAAAEIMASGAYACGTYEMCSEGTWSLADMKSILSELTGRAVDSAFLSDEAFLKGSCTSPESYAGQTLLTMFRHYNAHSFCGNSFAMTQILGRRPVTVRDYLQQALQ